MRVLMISGLAAVIVACGGNESGGRNMDRFVNGCNESTNLGKVFCECAGNNAREELSDDGFAFLAAMFDADDQELAALRAELGPSEAISAGMFMATAYKKCAPTE